jgi:hypothetical protein
MIKMPTRRSGQKYLRKGKTSTMRRKRKRVAKRGKTTRTQMSTACSMIPMRSLIIHLKSTSEGILFLGSLSRIRLLRL